MHRKHGDGSTGGKTYSKGFKGAAYRSRPVAAVADCEPSLPVKVAKELF